MEEKTDKNGIESGRDPVTGRFVEGNPGGGRPKGARSFTTKVKEALEKIAEGKEYTYEEAFIKALMHKAIVDKDPTIMKLFWNYFDGMPLQKFEGKIEEKSIGDVLDNLDDVKV